MQTTAAVTSSIRPQIDPFKVVADQQPDWVIYRLSRIDGGWIAMVHRKHGLHPWVVINIGDMGMSSGEYLPNFDRADSEYKRREKANGIY